MRCFCGCKICFWQDRSCWPNSCSKLAFYFCLSIGGVVHCIDGIYFMKYYKTFEFRKKRFIFQGNYFRAANVLELANQFNLRKTNIRKCTKHVGTVLVWQSPARYIPCLIWMSKSSTVVVSTCENKNTACVWFKETVSRTICFFSLDNWGSISGTESYEVIWKQEEKHMV